MTESTNKIYDVHYSTAKLDDNTHVVQLIIGENKREQMIMNKEEIIDFLKFASKYGYIADRIEF